MGGRHRLVVFMVLTAACTATLPAADDLAVGDLASADDLAADAPDLAATADLAVAPQADFAVGEPADLSVIEPDLSVLRVSCQTAAECPGSHCIPGYCSGCRYGASCTYTYGADGGTCGPDEICGSDPCYCGTSDTTVCMPRCQITGCPHGTCGSDGRCHGGSCYAGSSFGCGFGYFCAPYPGRPDGECWPDTRCWGTGESACAGNYGGSICVNGQCSTSYGFCAN